MIVCETKEIVFSFSTRCYWQGLNTDKSESIQTKIKEIKLEKNSMKLIPYLEKY